MILMINTVSVRDIQDVHTISNPEVKESKKSPARLIEEIFLVYSFAEHVKTTGGNAVSVRDITTSALCSLAERPQYSLLSAHCVACGVL